MTFASSEQHIEQEYHVSLFIVAYKFLFGLAEFALGAGIVFIGKNALTLYHVYAMQELAEDPHDIVIRLTEHIIPNLLTHQTFLALYLILLGAAKMAGAVGLLYKKTWGVDLLVALTLIMFPFQFVQLIRHPFLADFLYIFIGLFIALYLINFRPHEWAKKVIRRVKR